MLEFGFRNYSIKTNGSCRTGGEGIWLVQPTMCILPSVKDAHALRSFLSSHTTPLTCLISRTYTALRYHHVWGLVQRVWREESTRMRQKTTTSHRSSRNTKGWARTIGSDMKEDRVNRWDLHRHSFSFSLERHPLVGADKDLVVVLPWPVDRLLAPTSNFSDPSPMCTADRRSRLHATPNFANRHTCHPRFEGLWSCGW